MIVDFSIKKLVARSKCYHLPKRDQHTHQAIQVVSWGDPVPSLCLMNYTSRLSFWKANCSLSPWNLRKPSTHPDSPSSCFCHQGLAVLLSKLILATLFSLALLTMLLSCFTWNHSIVPQEGSSFRLTTFQWICPDLFIFPHIKHLLNSHSTIFLQHVCSLTLSTPYHILFYTIILLIPCISQHPPSSFTSFCIWCFSYLEYQSSLWLSLSV